jgi:hypothetical protein
VPQWTYRVAGGLAPSLPRWLTPGRYRLTIYAWDWADNATALDRMVTLTPSGWRTTDRFPKSILDGTWSLLVERYGYLRSRNLERPRLER